MVHQRAHIQGLDVLRGIAVGLVIVRHAWPETFGGAGIVGVVMFFALSGYLITGIIMRDITSSGRINYRKFYRNRALRLLPAMLTLLIIFSVVELVVGPTGGTRELLIGVAVGGLYLQDLLPFLAYPGINHLWTLAVEEQFYLIWPALMLMLVRRKWLKKGLLAAILIAVAVCSISVVAASQLFSVDVIYALPTTWASALMIGGAAYVFRDSVASFYAPRAGVLVLAAIAFLALFCVSPDAKQQAVTYLLGGPLVAGATVILISYLQAWRTLPSRAWAPLRALGIVSYGAYLWNGPAVHWTVDVAKVDSWVSIPLTITAAAASWWLVERSALRLKDRLNVGTSAPQTSGVQ